MIRAANTPVKADAMWQRWTAGRITLFNPSIAIIFSFIIGGSSECVTSDSTTSGWPNGVEAGVACTFPFTYGDIMYTECTDADTVGQYWCAVAGWSDSSSWGWCDCNDSDAQLPPTPRPPAPLPPTTTVDAEHQSAGCSASAASSFGGPGATTNLNMGGMQHKLTLPTNYVQGRPAAALLYFHGWGGSSSECGSHCETAAAAAGFVTVALSGYGTAWANAGSVSSSNNAICASASPDYCPTDCSQTQCQQSDGCWWTTCKDSVAQVVEVLDWLEEHLCLDTTHIWAQGSSNGGMFTYDLAVDSRTSRRFAGIAPGIGLPHYGFNAGPSDVAAPMSFIGVWGKADTTVPPIPTAHQGSGSHPDRTFDTAYGGWYYSSAASTTTLWAVNNGCIDSAGSAVTFAEVEAWGIESASDLECTRYLHCPAGVDVSFIKNMGFIAPLLGPGLVGALGLWAYISPAFAFGFLALLFFKIHIGCGWSPIMKYQPSPLRCSRDSLDGELIMMIHGWPDNKEVWNQQAAHLRKTHRVVRLELPNFNGDIVDTFGYDFDDLVTASIAALELELEAAGQKKAILLIHDWGSFVGGQLQRRRPDLVSKMIILDVVWAGDRGFQGVKGKMLGLATLVVLGLFYQWWAAACWVVAAGVPVIGPKLGDAMMNLQLRNMGRLPETSLGTKGPGRRHPPSALMNYPYFYFQVQTVLQVLGLRPDFDTRHKIEPKETRWFWEEGGIPALFMHGADKGFDFHPPFLVKKLQKRPECKVVALKKGEPGCPTKYKAGHWIPVTCPVRINSEIDAWLGVSSSGGGAAAAKAK